MGKSDQTFVCLILKPILALGSSDLLKEGIIGTNLKVLMISFSLLFQLSLFL